MLGRSEKDRIYRHFEPVLGDSKETANRMVGWSKFFFGDPANKAHFWIRTHTIPDVHYGIYQQLAENHKFIVVTSPRGFGKTTIDSIIYPLYNIYYGLDRVIILIGKIEGSGQRVLRNIKREIEQNPKLNEVYGALRPSNTKSGLWSQSEIRTKNDVFLRSIGMGGDIRGSLDAMYRPTLILIDDPQSQKTVKEPATLEFHEDYFDNDVVYALDEDYGRIRFIGNRLPNRNCLINKVAEDKRFKLVEFSALVDDDGKPDIHGHSIWEEKFPTKRLKSEKDYLASKGKLHVFMAQRMNIITEQLEKSLKGYKFHNLEYKRINEQNVLVGDEYPDPIRVNTFLAIDPAFAQTDNADERALVVFAKGRILQTTNFGKPYWFNCLWILEYIFNHMDPSSIIDHALEFHRQYYFDSIFTEAISGAQLIQIFLEQFAVSDPFFSRFPCQLIPIKYQTANKKDRIYSGLQPRVKLGQVFLRRSHTEIVEEMENFELYKSPHLLDAIEMGNRYSYESTAQYEGSNQLYRRYEEKTEEEHQMSHNGTFGKIPTNLSEIMGF